MDDKNILSGKQNNLHEITQLQYKLSGKKIAYFFHESYLGGATLHLFKHAQFMKEAGFDILLCLPLSQKAISSLNERAAVIGEEIHYLPYYIYVEVVYDNEAHIHANEIKKWMTDNNVGLAHSVTYIPAVGLACKAIGIRHIATLHRFYDCHLTKEEIKDNPLIDYVHSSSHKYADIWNYYLQVPSKKICCAVEDEYFKCYQSNSMRSFTKDKTINILLSGTIQPRKNQLEAIKAVKILKKRGYNIRLYLIGYNRLFEDYVSECECYIKENDLVNEVQILGFVEKPLDFYNAFSDILLCCSTEESMPQTILQAMAAGVLAVTTDVGGVDEIIINGHSGVIYKGADCNSIAKGLKSGIKRLGCRKILEDANKCAKAVCSSELVKTNLIDLYNQVLSI
jgi:glycosyltransferase involved in cell wall biosynthesis